MVRLSPDGGRPIASLLLLTIVVIGATGVASMTVTARAPPEPVCGVCTQALDRAADDRDIHVERGTSKIIVQVHPNGTATFTARVSLTQGADPLRNATLRRAIVRDVSYIVAEERRDLHTRIDRATLVVRYRSAVAHRSLGVVRFDAFETAGAPPLASGGEGPPYPGADTLFLRAPADYRVHDGYGDSANDTAIVWYGDSHEQYAGQIKDDVVISFVPKDATVPAIRVRLAALFGDTSTVTALTFFFTAFVIGGVAVLIREYELMWLIAGYNPERVTDDEGLARFVGLWLLIIAGLNAVIGVSELALSSDSMTMVYGITLVATVVVVGYMIYGAQRYTTS